MTTDNKAAHTPGPWEAHLSGVVYDSTGNPLKVASGWIEDTWCDDHQTDETRANSRLIATAPELLSDGAAAADALDLMLKCWAEGREISDEEGRQATAALMRFNAAIAKARGSHNHDD